jgi:hypothetical protein
MTGIILLWLPILSAAVLVFVASSSFTWRARETRI